MNNNDNKKLRNVAIIAHVDHGKTTLVDCLLKQSGTFRANEKVAERVMDNNDLERERGITILSKNTSVYYEDLKINIVDTPGHADFGGEVERVLKMVDGALLLVDAFEGPMAQTKFVLRKALEAGLRIIVVINKIDRPDARANEVLNEVFDLFVELEAEDWQLEFPVIYASSRQGVASEEPYIEQAKDMMPLFKMIKEEIPEPSGDVDAPLQIQINTLDYDDYVGRIGIGRVYNGKMSQGQQVAVCKDDGTVENVRVGKIWINEGLKRVETTEVMAGEIVALAGVGQINIGETITEVENPCPMPMLTIDEPTLTMDFIVNNSPFSGREGKFVTSRHLRERLYKEAETNVSLRVEDTESPDSFHVSGRGELHLAVLIETMRREGFEFQVSKPEPILKKVNDEIQEPYERLFITVAEEFSGNVIENLGMRRADMVNMQPSGVSNVKLEFIIPARGLIGFRSEFLTATKGEGIMNHIYSHYGPWKGEISSRHRGVLVAFEDGEANSYGLSNVEDRGVLFVGSGQPVYIGMIVGEHSRETDLDVNICKKKHLTNMRASGSDDTTRLTPPLVFSLEQCMEYIEEDELLEVTPSSLRMRKKILDRAERARLEKRRKDALN